MEKEYNYIPDGYEQLDEAIPRDLAQAYRYGNKTDARSDNQTTSYGNIYANDEIRSRVNNKSDRLTSTIDFQAAEYKKLTYDEAVVLAKSNPEALRIVFCGELITLKKDEKGKIKQDRHVFYDDVISHAANRYKGERSWFYYSDEAKDILAKFTRPSGEEVNSSSKLTVNTVLQRADAIYQVISEPMNTGRQNRDVMSKYYVDSDRLVNKYRRYHQPKNSWYPRYDDVNYVDRYSYAAASGTTIPYYSYKIDGQGQFTAERDEIGNDLYRYADDGWRVRREFSYGQIYTLKDRLEQLVNKNQWLKQLGGRTPAEFPEELRNSEFSQETYNYYIALNRAIQFLQRIKRWEDSDIRAGKINAYSDAALNQLAKRAMELKARLKSLEDDIENKKDKINTFQSRGSNQSINLRNRLQDYQEEVIKLFKSMSEIEERLKTIDADDAAELANLNKELGDLEQEYNQVKKELSKHIYNPSKTESLSDNTGDDENLGEGICFDNNLNQVWDDLNRVEDYDQEDEYLDDYIDD